MTDEEWNESTIQRYIDDKVEESLTLEYKAAGALAKTQAKKSEIGKDVSAMANSAGGIVIYGVSESRDERHLPGEIDPVARTEFSKEWLEQVINNVRPRIQGVMIAAVPVDSSPDAVVYVVEVPASTTAHQAIDLKYYKRYNFLSQPMADHEIRDVMNRASMPLVEVAFEAKRLTQSGARDTYKLIIVLINKGRKVVHDTKLQFDFPDLDVVFGSQGGDGGGRLIRVHRSEEQTRVERVDDLVRFSIRSSDVLFPEDQVDVTELIQLEYDVNRRVYLGRGQIPPLQWRLYADDMPPKNGEVAARSLFPGY